jgi:2-oxoisovalerate dehydrogenase E1 component
MNLAELWGLPVLFVCENNLYAMGVPLEQADAETDIYRKANAYRMPTEAVDGMNPVAVETAARRAVDSIRAGNGPYFLECRTYRFRAHSMFDAQLYRTREEIELWKKRDPITCMRLAGGKSPCCPPAELARIEADVDAEMEEAVAFAEASDWEPVEDLERFRADGRGAGVNKAVTQEGHDAPMTYREACRQAIREALTSDPRTFVMGEDVGLYGGCYAVTKGLLDEFGPSRIRDTPLSESAFVGAGIGAAMAGLRPIVEIMTCNFSLLALDQIINNAATIPHMSGGQFAVPLVIRMATGAGRQLAAQHSHSLEGWYGHIPGIKVLAPGTVEDARHMLKPALADPNPVLIFEHIVLYNAEGELDPAVEASTSARPRSAGRGAT